MARALLMKPSKSGEAVFTQIPTLAEHTGKG
jgi:hypothetical protein